MLLLYISEYVRGGPIGISCCEEGINCLLKGEVLNMLQMAWLPFSLHVTNIPKEVKILGVQDGLPGVQLQGEPFV